MRIASAAAAMAIRRSVTSYWGVSDGATCVEGSERKLVRDGRYVTDTDWSSIGIRHHGPQAKGSALETRSSNPAIPVGGALAFGTSRARRVSPR